MEIRIKLNLGYMVLINHIYHTQIHLVKRISVSSRDVMVDINPVRIEE